MVVTWALPRRTGRRTDGDLQLGAHPAPARPKPSCGSEVRGPPPHPNPTTRKPQTAPVPARSQTKQPTPAVTITNAPRLGAHPPAISCRPRAGRAPRQKLAARCSTGLVNRDGRSNVPAAALVGEPAAVPRRRRRSGAGASMGAAAVGGGAAGMRGAAAVLVRRRPRVEAGLGGALREGLGRRTGEEGKEELVGGGGGRGRGGGGVRLRKLRAQLRRWVWKAEEGVSWAGPGGAFPPRASDGDAAAAAGDSLPSSTC